MTLILVLLTSSLQLDLTQLVSQTLAQLARKQLV